MPRFFGQRLLPALVLVTITSTAAAQSTSPGRGDAGGATPPAANGGDERRVEAGRPFPPPSEAAAKRLDQLLTAWERSSQATKNLAAEFTRWHFDLVQAPAGVHSTWAQGAIKYAAPDKGMFKVDTLKFYKGMQDGQPVYESDPKNVGEYWVCNGEELIDFDRAKKECRIQALPPELRGQKIFESPLPFVFNLDADDIQTRYWVREVQPPQGKTGVYVLEAWPKRQADRAQYRFVKIVIGQKEFLPEALIIYAPNFHPQNAPVWDHYEFRSVSRNAMLSNVQQFMDTFIKARPPSDWKVIRENFGAVQQAASPQGPAVR